MNLLIERLRKVDEITLMELLEINSDDIVDAFLDKITDNEERLWKVFQEEIDQDI